MGIMSIQPDLFCCALAWQGWSQLTRNTLMWIQKVFLVLSCQRVKYTDVDTASVALFCLDRGGYSWPKYTDVFYPVRESNTLTWIQQVLLCFVLTEVVTVDQNTQTSCGYSWFCYHTISCTTYAGGCGGCGFSTLGGKSTERRKNYISSGNTWNAPNHSGM